MGGVKTGLVRIGFGDVGCFDKKTDTTVLQIQGIVSFKGKCHIGFGSRIVVGENAFLEFGKDFSLTAHSTIIAMKGIKFGNNVLISWGVLIMDSDFHFIVKDGRSKRNCSKAIAIGNHVWIGCRCTILKGVSIGNNSVVAANSVVTKRFEENNILIAGHPAAMKSRNVNWNQFCDEYENLVP